MKRTETVTEPRQVEKVVEWACDICGASRDTWTSKEQYAATDTEMHGDNLQAASDVELQMTGSYPEGGVGNEWTVDVCPTCFVTKLIPWVESFGRAKIQPRDLGW